MTEHERLTPAQEAERDTWQYKAVLATRGNQTLLGCIVLAIMGRNAKHPPAVGANCLITDDGRIITRFLTRTGQQGHIDLGPVKDVVDEFRRLADLTRMSDEQRVAMFDELRKWVVKDYRATSDPEEWDNKRKEIMK